jgi:hypothetical protein
MSCTGTVRDATGDTVAQESMNFASMEIQSGHSNWPFSSPILPPAVLQDGSSLTGGLDCTPYVGPKAGHSVPGSS